MISKEEFLFFFWRNLYRVVGFEVEPKSIDSKRITVESDGSCAIEAGQEMQKIDPKGLKNSFDFIKKMKFISRRK
jgi:hypothetical protein